MQEADPVGPGPSKIPPAHIPSVRSTLRAIGREIPRHKWRIIDLNVDGTLRIHIVDDKGDGGATISSSRRRGGADAVINNLPRRPNHARPATSSSSVRSTLKKRLWRFKGLAGRILHRRIATAFTRWFTLNSSEKGVVQRNEECPPRSLIVAMSLCDMTPSTSPNRLSAEQPPPLQKRKWND